MKSSSERLDEVNAENPAEAALARGQKVSFPEALSATMERIRIKREERIRTAPPCAVCGNSILADEPSHSPDIEEWTLYNATHEKLCFKHFRIEYAKAKLSWRNEHADKALIAAGVSEEFSNRSFENYQLTAANRQFFTAVKNWAENPRAFLAILSPFTGIGKTHLSIAALRRFYVDTGRSGRKVHFCRISEKATTPTPVSLRAVRPASRVAVDPLYDVVSNVHRVDAVGEDLHDERVLEARRLERLVPPARSFDEGVPHILRRAVVDIIDDRLDRFADSSIGIFLLKPGANDQSFVQCGPERR